MARTTLPRPTPKVLVKLDLKNKTVAIIGSGPSLRREDCALIQRAGLDTVAINSSWAMAPFCKIVFAGDYAWWNKNKDLISIGAERWTSCVDAAHFFGIKHYHSKIYAWNSGLRAIELVETFGAKKAILLGFDCRVDFGKHWHPDHVGTSNPNPKVCLDWKQQFNRYARTTKMEIVNCSRDSALLCFPRVNLEDALC